MLPGFPLEQRSVSGRSEESKRSKKTAFTARTKNEIDEDLKKKLLIPKKHIDINFEKFLMSCTEDRLEQRYYKEIDLESSHTADLFKYYNDFYRKGKHEYSFDVKFKPKRV